MQRITINLTKAASNAIARVKDITEESMTDTINHALLVYGIICEAQDKGGAMYIQREKDSTLERVLLV